MFLEAPKLTPKEVERLLKYREVMQAIQLKGKTHVLSKELAAALNISPEQVRHDTMHLRIKGKPRVGYVIESFLDEINKFFAAETNACIVGLGNLGKALISYFNTRKTSLNLIVALDNDAEKSNRIFAGTYVYHTSDMDKIVGEKNIRIAVLAVPAEHAQKVTDSLIKAGVKAILNFAPVTLNVPADIFLENIDITLSLEKASYFALNTNNRRQ